MRARAIFILEDCLIALRHLIDEVALEALSPSVGGYFGRAFEFTWKKEAIASGWAVHSPYHDSLRIPNSVDDLFHLSDS